MQFGPRLNSRNTPKKTGTALSVQLKMMWKTLIRLGIIHISLKTGNIRPIYKGGDRTRPKNDRPISLTAHIIKIFEKNY